MGVFIFSLTVTDDGGLTGTDTQSVPVSSGSDPQVELLTSSENNGSSWTANVRTLDGSNLSGSWSYSGGTASCAGDTCSLSGIRKKESSVVFTSSGGTTITVYKP